MDTEYEPNRADEIMKTELKYHSDDKVEVRDEYGFYTSKQFRVADVKTIINKWYSVIYFQLETENSDLVTFDGDKNELLHYFEECLKNAPIIPYYQNPIDEIPNDPPVLRRQNATYHK